jgi:hypothetical protein
MERMDMYSRNEYLKVLRERYLKAKTKKEKSQILDEYCRNTAQTRKYVIRKIQPRVDMRPKQRKNDNAYIEQKNWTHVRKVLGYLRYDTAGELTIINDLYRGELRLYKNFFQPVMKLISKERIGGRVKRKYDIPQSPYQRLMESDQVSEETKRGLEAIYLSLNPAQLKRSIDAKLDDLYHTYEEKGRAQQVDPLKRLVPRTVTSFMMQQDKVGLPT